MGKSPHASNLRVSGRIMKMRKQVAKADAAGRRKLSAEMSALLQMKEQWDKTNWNCW
jgi:hypothetical protein